MSWSDVHKLKPQKPQPEQDLDSLSEFLVWDMEFKLKHLSEELPNTLSQDVLGNDLPPLQLLNTIKQV